VTTTTRPVGRPRSPEADRAILDAALELFAECGFDGLTVEGVAARAAVGKGTIYRRYAGKIDLVMAAAKSISETQSPAPDTGSVDDDLRSLARGLVRVLTRTPAGPAVCQLVSELPRNPELAEAHRAFVDTRRSMVVAVVRRGIERGELRAGVDAGRIADSIAGPIFYRYLVTQSRLDNAYADSLVDQVMLAFGTSERSAR
jgi:AcrR family transcriptional regulator